MTEAQMIVETHTVHALGLEHAGQMRFFHYDEGPLPQNHFRVETLYSGLSAGTELTFYKGTNPHLHARWDADMGVFRRDRPGVSAPLPFMGFMEVARVTESRCRTVAPGMLLAMCYGHQSGHTAHGDEFVVPLPADLPALLGIYLAQQGPICANGLLHAAADQMGRRVETLADGVRERNVVVVGAGATGLLLGLWARHLGAAEVAVIDSTPERLAAAEALGLTAIPDRDGSAWRACKQRWWHGLNDRGADLAFQCRGQTAALGTALRCLRPQGTVIDLAFYQSGAADLRLGEEFHHNGLTIRCAQIDNPPRSLSWDHARLADETIRFLRDCGTEVQEHIITDIVPFSEAPGFIADLAERRRHAIQAVFAF